MWKPGLRSTSEDMLLAFRPRNTPPNPHFQRKGCCLLYAKHIGSTISWGLLETEPHSKLHVLQLLKHFTLLNYCVVAKWYVFLNMIRMMWLMCQQYGFDRVTLFLVRRAWLTWVLIGEKLSSSYSMGKSFSLSDEYWIVGCCVSSLSKSEDNWITCE